MIYVVSVSPKEGDRSVFKMESPCEVNPPCLSSIPNIGWPIKDDCESQTLKNQGLWGYLHQNSKPESTITSKTIEFESIESQDDYNRRGKIIGAGQGMRDSHIAGKKYWKI